MEKLKNKKFLLGVSLTILLIAVLFWIYLSLIPRLISSNTFINFVEGNIEKSLKVDIEIIKPNLKTYVSPNIAFSVDKLIIKQNDKVLLYLLKFDTRFSFARLLEKRITFKKLGADYIYTDVDSLLTLFKQEKPKKENKKPDFRIGLFNSLLYIKKCNIIYSYNDNTTINFAAQNLKITGDKNPKKVSFDILCKIIKNGKTLTLTLKDEDKVVIKGKDLIIDNCFLGVNNSKVYIKSKSNENFDFNIDVYSDNFKINDVVELIKTDFIIPNGSEMMSYFKDIQGTFDLKINLSNKGLDGNVKLNKSKITLIPLADLKLTVNEGKINITPKEITLSDIKGYYGSSKDNPVEVKGIIKDYTNSFDTYILVSALATNEFSKDNLSKIVGYPIEIVGNATSKIVYKQKYSDMDIACVFLLKKGSDLLIDGASLSPVNYDRALGVDIGLKPDNIEIRKIDYYIASTIDRNSKIKPLLTIFGNLDAKTAAVKNIGFKIPKPLPSEFLNVLIGQRVFRKGLISGDLEFINDKIPYLKANLNMEKVRIPAQRLVIKKANLSAYGKSIVLTSNGKFKRSDYNLDGNILNEIKLPVVIKDINLTVDNIDIERILKSFNSQQDVKAHEKEQLEKLVVATDEQIQDEDDTDNAFSFNTGLLIIDKCSLNVIKGVYKQINFSDLIATLTLNKDGILEVKSNRFNIADGISSCKVYCDLIKHNYSVILGAKDINSDIMATSILNLKKEISGKASGIIKLYTDKTFALNGDIKFVVNDGTIGKVGLIEYALKFAALFRNPLAMISPSSFMDLVNIPEGRFDKITGELTIKNNVVERILIKSSSPQLSSLIFGRFDLITRDATLRIYTKFSSSHKGFSGFLRNISLNSLANRVPLGSRNDSNYYEAELKHLPPIDADEKDCQVFLTKVDGDVEKNNFISSLKKIK